MSRSSLRLISFSALVVLIALSSLAFADSSGQYDKDSIITSQVRAALLRDARLKTSSIQVETSQGDVQLAGEVQDAKQEAQAVTLANSIDGVRLVRDGLTVRSAEQD